MSVARDLLHDLNMIGATIEPSGDPGSPSQSSPPSEGRTPSNARYRSTSRSPGPFALVRARGEAG
jgi:hypothetical protein